MRDFLTLDLRTADKRLISYDEQGLTQSLLVRVAATHSGIINGNMRFYRPDKMMTGTPTWVDMSCYPRPVLPHHDEEADPLGRVLEAKYVDLSYLYKADYPILNDSVFYCSDAKKRMSTLETVDWIVENLCSQKDYRGLGYIELGLKITEPDAIDKVLRKEFLTVSVGFGTDSAVCSVCHQDWAVDDRCDHQLGKKYDGKLAFVISGSMDFHECSFVNQPADPFATTLSIERLTDSRHRAFLLGLPLREQTERTTAAGLVLTDALYSADIERVEDKVEMIDLKAISDEIKSAGLTSERALAIRKELTDYSADTDAGKKQTKKLLSTVVAKIKANDWEVIPVRSVDSQKADSEIAAADAAVAKTVLPTSTSDTTDCADGACDWTDALTDDLDKAFFSRTEDELYADLAVELDAMKTEGVLTDAQMTDAKLSSEARKKLKGTSFCGPNRSFPAEDCAHVTAGKRLLGRASVSAATKAKIKGCLDRKGKSLGCVGKDGCTLDNADGLVMSDAVKKVFEMEQCKDAHEEVRGTVNTLDTQYAALPDDRKRHLRWALGSLISSWYSREEHDDYMRWLTKDEDSVMVIAKSEHDTLTDAITKFDATEKELRDAVVAEENSKLKILKQCKDTLATMIVLHKVLSGAKGFQGLTTDQISEAIAKRAGRDLSSLTDMRDEILEELQWAKPAGAASAAKVTEPTGLEVSDSAQVTDPAPKAGTDDAAKGAGTTVENTDAIEIPVKFPVMDPAESRRHAARQRFKKATE
jgi:hypothetical protein